MARRKNPRTDPNETEADEAEQARSNQPGKRDLAHHLKEISAAKQRKADADMALASKYSAAEECGLDKKAIKHLLKLRDQDSEKSKAEFQTLIKYLQWMDMPIGAQLHFFDDPTKSPEETAIAEGRQAGKEGASANTNPYPEGSKLYPRWEEGRMLGQADLVNGAGKVTPIAAGKKKRGRPPKGQLAELH
jgi:uncharacterized protein (UPF0335 family)